MSQLQIVVSKHWHYSSKQHLPWIKVWNFQKVWRDGCHLEVVHFLSLIWWKLANMAPRLLLEGLWGLSRVCRVPCVSQALNSWVALFFGAEALFEQEGSRLAILPFHSCFGSCFYTIAAAFPACPQGGWHVCSAMCVCVVLSLRRDRFRSTGPHRNPLC